MVPALARRVQRPTAGRPLNTGSINMGAIISGIGHLALILWVLLGDWLFRPQDVPEIAVADVSIISEAEFAALTQASAPAQPETEAPAQPILEPPTEEPLVETPPLDPVENEPLPKPVVPEPSPIVPETEALTPDPVPDEPPPEPVAEPEAEPVPVPEPEAVIAPETEAPQSEVPQPEMVLPSVAPQIPDVRPRRKPAAVIAPQIVDAPDEPSEVTPEIEPEVREVAVPDAPPVELPDEAITPTDTGETIITESNEGDVASTLAPTSSARPRRRVEPAPEPEVAVTPPQTAPDEAPTEQALTPEEVALSEALAAANAAEEPAPSGPPMTGGEKDALRVAVSSCWNVGSLSTAAMGTEVTVAVSVAQTGIPDAASIRMMGFVGGSAADAQRAFEAARRAIIRCGARGFPLPPEKYEQWKELELVFDPSGMRMR